MNDDYREKLRTVEEACALVNKKDSMGLPLGPGQPLEFLQKLGDVTQFEDLVIFAGLLSGPFPVLFQPGVHLMSGFFGPMERALRQAGSDIKFVPADFRRFETIAERLKPRIMATSVAPPGEDGRLSLSLHAGATYDEMERVGNDPDRLLIVEVNKNLPRTLGVPGEYDHSIPIEWADIIIESDDPVLALPDPEPSDTDKAIANHSLPFFKDGATIQTGIGGIPSEIVALLAESSGGDYGIHTEMFTDGLMKLHQAGKVTNKKGIYDGFSVTTFAAGTTDLYDWLHENEDVRFLPVDRTNDAAVIASNRNMVSINGALAVDLTGQIAADTIGGKQYSGIGGHHDFTSAATRGVGGRSLICMPSTAVVGEKTISKIQAIFPLGTTATTPRHDVDVVVTEHGAAELFGLTIEERVEALLAISHPDFRESLREEWDNIHPS